MSWMKATLQEIYGLFVDDLAFAAAIVAWLVAIAGLLRLLPGEKGWAGLLLAAGLLLLMVESATRYARRQSARK